jgi:serine protease Do
MRWLLLLAFIGIAGCDATAQAPQSADDAPLGVHVRELPAGTLKELGLAYGVMVTRVRAPADRSGLSPGDVIVGVNQTRIQSLQEFNRLVRAAPPGTVQLLVRRADEDVYIPLEPRAPYATGKPLRT